MVAFGLLFSNFVMGQEHYLRDPSTWTPTNTDFLQSFPFPATTSTSTQHIVGKGYNNFPTRGIFYGGNLGVSQHSFDYELPLGKWSFIGAWAKGNSSTVYPNGTYAVFNYLVNYHRWGNYSAHFGLRAATTTLSDGEAGQVSTDSDLKNAVITWGYEHGATQNRLIFQSFQGVDVSGTLPMTETEWATILSNGNIGSGLSAPTAQFQLKQLNSTNYPLMEMLDNGGISKFMFTKTGELFLGPGSGSATTTATTVLDIKGNVKIIQNTTATANVAFDVTGNSVFRSPSTADLAEKTINVRCNGTADNFWMSYGGDMYYYKYKAGTTTAALV